MTCTIVMQLDVPTVHWFLFILLLIHMYIFFVIFVYKHLTISIAVVS